MLGRVTQRWQSAVSGGVKRLVVTTLEAMRMVAVGAAWEYSLLAAATSIGTAAALAAVADAAMPAVPLPPIRLSMVIGTTADRHIVKTPCRRPRIPAVQTR